MQHLSEIRHTDRVERSRARPRQRSYPLRPLIKSHADPKVYEESVGGEFESSRAPARRRRDDRPADECGRSIARVTAVSDSPRLFKPLDANSSQIRHTAAAVITAARERQD
jgi:hypothetical protein